MNLETNDMLDELNYRKKKCQNAVQTRMNGIEGNDLENGAGMKSYEY